MHISKTKLLKIGKNTAKYVTIVLKQQKRQRKILENIKTFFTDKNKENEIVTDNIKNAKIMKLLQTI